MSLFKEAADMLRNLAGRGDMHATSIASELDTAHNTQLATHSGPGRRVVISSGQQDAGYLVEIHDGDRFRTFGLEAANEEDALAKAEKRFRSESVPQTGPVVERPNQSDPNAIDVTRGRDNDPVDAPQLTEQHLGHKPEDTLDNGTNVHGHSMSPMTEDGLSVSPEAAEAQHLPVDGGQREEDKGAQPDQLQGAEPANEVAHTLETPGDHLAEAERRAAEGHEG